MKKLIIYNVFFLLLFSFIFLEFIFPHIFKTPNLKYKFYDNKPYTFYPNLSLRIVSSEFDIKFKTNKYGFNDNEFQNETDILILGDSFVEAIQVNRQDHFTSLIKNEFPKLKINKIGMSSLGNSHYFANYMHYKNKLDPKMVIIFNVPNDIENNFCNQNTMECLTLDEVCEINNKKQLDSNIKFLKILENNFYFNYIRNNEQEFLKSVNYNSLKHKIYINILYKFQTYHSLRKIKSMVLKKRIIEQNKKDALKKGKCKFFSDNIYARNYYNQINKLLYDQINKVDKKKILFVNVYISKSNKINHDEIFIREEFKINNYPHINLLDNFSEDYTNSDRSAFFEINGHWNKKGHKIVANALINYLKNIKLD